mgnify:CR=1 FL=1
MAARKEHSLPEVGNPKAGRDYFIGQTYEAGLMLLGTEVKSLRDGKAQLLQNSARLAHLLGVGLRQLAAAEPQAGRGAAQVRRGRLHGHQRPPTPPLPPQPSAPSLQPHRPTTPATPMCLLACLLPLA